MGDRAIQVDNLGKCYTIAHEERQRYVALRDVIADRSRRIGRTILSPLRCSVLPASSQSREDFWALRDVSFEIKQGDRVGIIGRNGAGKSTLLKLLARITEPTTGRITLRGRVASLLEVGTGFHPELTGRENIFLNGAILGMSKQEIKSKFDEIVDFAEIEKFLDTPVKRYSSGMYVRLAFAVAAHLEPEILLVDEVLAVGDAQFQKKCLGKMEDVSSRDGRTVLFVSHNMAAIAHLCNSAILLLDGKLRTMGLSAKIIGLYEYEISQSHYSQRHSPGLVYAHDTANSESTADFEIIKIEIVGQDDQPKAAVYTWDTVTFRIHYWARVDIIEGSAVLFVSTRSGVRLLLCSTQPDSGVPMKIKRGNHSVECRFPSLSLSAGDYVIGAGLAIPNKEWLCKKEDLGLLRVFPKDVFKSGSAPTSPRSLLAIPHKWVID